MVLLQHDLIAIGFEYKAVWLQYLFDFLQCDLITSWCGSICLDLVWLWYSVVITTVSWNKWHLTWLIVLKLVFACWESASPAYTAACFL